MKLEQKYFVPFMAVGALLTMIFIVYSSFNFKENQARRFTEYTAQYDSLLVLPNPYVIQEDSLRLEELQGSETVVLFWATWSEKSASIMKELNDLKKKEPGLEIIAALVHDATETAIPEIPDYDFRYIDGTILFNEIRVPGIPSYLLLDEEGRLIYTHVGYQSGQVSEIPQQFSEL